MQVKMIRTAENNGMDGVTIGNIYYTPKIDDVGDVEITDDDGNTSYLFSGEFEVVEE